MRRHDKRRGPGSKRDECEVCGPDCEDSPEGLARCLCEAEEDAHKVEWHWASGSGDQSYSHKERRGPGGRREVEWHWASGSGDESYSYKERRQEADKIRRQAWEAAHAHLREHWKHHRHRNWRQHWRMSQLGHFVRARLHRRLFLWFGLSIFMTCVVVATVFNLVGGTTWKQEMERMRNFAGHRFEEVWDQPARRDALAQSIAKDLDVDVEIKDASDKVLVLAGGLCTSTELTIPVVRGETTLGQARLCYGSKRGKDPLKIMLPMLAACLVLWMASGKMARRLAKPVDVLVQATEALGSGRLNARAEVHPHATGEFAVLGVAFNDMARRIEKQVADQRELLAAVSHELRTPLARLRVLTELLRDGGGNPKTLDQVDREVVELDALVGELLASSRLDFGQITPRVLDGRTLATQALERAGLALELLDVDAPDAGLVGDATLLGRALANLLDNARRHGGGAKALRIQQQGEHLAFCVEDSGPGFQEGEETRIFQPFYRKDQSAEAREAGSLGLGLALIERIAQAHDGTTFAENREGGGARVGFTVRKAGPVREEKAAAA
ncbi:sensor histidine kinase [Myxococcus stipitatus]|uniref:sensor histidine kinase n=1 Tax=Myxococcus stipitatus TaxID=83455 RepID=UPI0030D13C4E